MAIKMRRGADADFRPEKMQPGELAVTVDGTRKVYAAFAAGDVKELSSKEDVDKTIASGLQSLETSTNNKLQSLEKKASSAVDKISSENQRVQEELSRYEYYTKTESDLKYTVAPRKEASSDTGELKLTDADEGLSYLALQGNSEQYQATGANLFDVKQMLKNMETIAPGSAKIVMDGNIKAIQLKNDAYYAKKIITFKNDPTKSYQMGCRAKFIKSDSGGYGIRLSANFKNGTTRYSGMIGKDTSYKFIAISIDEGEELSYIGFDYTNGVATYNIDLDSFYIYPKDAFSNEKPTGGYGTPSPEYPSEVRSVGDIPKDVNGVEIRNLLDEDWIRSLTESVWDKYIDTENNYVMYRYALPDEFKKRLTTMGRITGIIDNLNNYRIILLNKQGIKPSYLLNLNGLEGTGSVDYTGEEIVYFAVFIHKTQVATFDQVKEILYNMNLMITEAAEIDEYRPYIGENNGLVKLESTELNKADPNKALATMYSTVTVNSDGSKIKVLQTRLDATSRYIFDFNYKKNTDYTLYCKCWYEIVSGSGGYSVIAIRDVGGTQSAVIQMGVESTKSELRFTFNTGDNDNLGVWAYVQTTGSSSIRVLYVEDLMVVEGTKTLQEMQALKFQPYYQQITWIPLREPLRKIATFPDYSDTLDKDGNVTVKVVTRHVKDLDITATRPPYGVNNDVVFTIAYTNIHTDHRYDTNVGLGQYPNNDFAGSASLCNYFKMLRVETPEGEEGFGAGTLGVQPHYITIRYKYSRIGKTSADTDTVIKQAITQWVQENDPVLYLTLQPTSQFVDLYRYQIPAVYIETHDPETHVRCLSKVKPSDMTLDYKIAMSSLIKRLEALESKTVQEV